jgi:hypothetical protein
MTNNLAISMADAMIIIAIMKYFLAAYKSFINGRLFPSSYIFKKYYKNHRKKCAEQNSQKCSEKISEPEHFKVKKKEMMDKNDHEGIYQKPFESVNPQ